MAVQVRVGAALSTLLGGRQEAQAEGATVGEIIQALGLRERLCDGQGQIRRHFNIHVNQGEDVRLLHGLDTPVREGDSVTILSAIAGGGQVSRKIWLAYPEELIERPLIWEVGRKFNVVTNIRQASVSGQVGIVGLEVSGEEEEVKRAIEFFIENGVSVQPIELGVLE